MTSWRKRLARLMSDRSFTGYRYSELESILRQLGFEESSPGNGSSHRKWRLARSGRPAVWVGLVDKGHGEVKKGYVREMRDTLLREGIAADESQEVDHGVVD